MSIWYKERTLECIPDVFITGTNL